MIQQFYLDMFRRLHRRGLTAYRAGDWRKARADLLRSAEMLYKLAAGSSGPLRQARKEKAGKILGLAKSIEPKGTPQPRPKQRLPVGEEDASREGGEKWIVTDVPEVRMEDVAGLEDVKATIRRRVVYPFQHPEVAKKYRKRAGGGVLLYGPPGTGKTMIAKAVANEVSATFFSVKCSDIMSKWVGEAEQNLKGLFEAARQRERSVVFMDETEAIVAKRGSGSTVMDRVIPEFLSQVDGLQGQEGGLLLLGATNRPWDMDEAALRPGRFDELIYVPLPDLEARREIVAVALAGIPLAEEVDVNGIALDTEGLSGADLVALCEAMKDAPYEREIRSGAPQRVEPEDVGEALSGLRPSVTKAQLAKYRKFRDGRWWRTR